MFKITRDYKQTSILLNLETQMKCGYFLRKTQITVLSCTVQERDKS